MKIIKKITKLLLIIVLFLMIFNNLENVSSMSEEELKSTATYGDIYNPQLNTLGTSTTITGHNYANGTSYENLDVEVQKVVNKTSEEGIYNIEFLIRGKQTTSMSPGPSYIVFVIDKSYSMRSQGIWSDAKEAVINMSTVLSNMENVQMAAVYFEGATKSDAPYNDTGTLRSTFSSSPLTSDELGSISSDNSLHGATNMQGGLREAELLLENVEGEKFIIMISDGVPTLYYDDEGYSAGPGNSNEQAKLDKIPEVVDATKEKADTLKNEGIEIFSIGYYLDKYTRTISTTYNGIKYTEYMFAVETIRYVATNEHYYFQVDSSDTSVLNDAMAAIVNRVSITYPGKNVTIIDSIGPEFKLIDNNEYGGTKTITTNDIFRITNDWQSLGNFNVEIDKASPTGWYETNANFNVTYYDSWGTKKTIDVNENPEVYWGHNVKLCETFLKEDKHQFNFHITGQNYDSWINLNENTCQTLYLSPGTYTITEVLDKEITLDSINGISNNGGQLIVETGNNYIIEFVNNYDKKNYFHLNGNVVNIITNGGN